MSTPNEPLKPIIDFCCGSYCSEAGCCTFPHEPKYDPKQGELLPDHINIHRKFRYPEFTSRGEKAPPRASVPDWVKENRNRDSGSNLD